MSFTKEKQRNVFDALKEKLGYRNVFQTPRVTKVVVSAGTGSIKDKHKLEAVRDRLARITGQQPAPRAAKKSIASFKLREGDVIGQQVTLRGARMYDFLDKLIHIALPRTRDFRGIPRTAVDEMGNITIGIREHTIFPETSDEDIRDVFGVAITIVTTARSREEAISFLESIGVPLRKEQTA